MASSRTDHNVRDPASSTDGTGTDSRHNPQNTSFTSQSWADKAKQQERSSFNIAPNLDNAFDAQNVQSYFSQTTPFLEATEPYSIVMDCSQFEGMTFEGNKELNVILREQYPAGLILTMRAVGKTKKFFEISFLNEEGRVEALNRPFKIQDKEIVVSPTLGSGSRIVRVGITGIPGMDSATICKRLTEILSPCGDILELGLHYMPSGHWFNGRGFATLNCASDKTYNGKLKHQMPFNQHRNITLVWSNMGVVCKECHSDEHIKADCPVYRERTVKRCHKCQSMKHLKADCPEMPWNRRRKQPRRDSSSGDSSQGRDARGTQPRIQGRPNGPPPTTTFNPFSVLNFDDGSKDNQGQGSNTASAVSQAPKDNGEPAKAASTTTSQADGTPVPAAAEHSVNIAVASELNLDQQGGQHSGLERQSLDWATDGNPKFIDVEDDDSVMEMESNVPGWAAGAQDDGMQTDGEEAGNEASLSLAAASTNLQQGADANLSTGNTQGEGQRQRQFNRDGSLNSGFQSRSGRAYKSPDRL